MGDWQSLPLLLVVALVGTAQLGECDDYVLLPNLNVVRGDRYGCKMLAFFVEIHHSRLNSDNLSFELSPKSHYWMETNSAESSRSEFSQRNNNEPGVSTTFNLLLTGDYYYDYTMSYRDYYIIFLRRLVTENQRPFLAGPYVVPRKLQTLVQKQNKVRIQLQNEKKVTITNRPMSRPHQPDTNRFFIFTFPELLPNNGTLPSHFEGLYTGKWSPSTNEPIDSPLHNRLMAARFTLRIEPSKPGNTSWEKTAFQVKHGSLEILNHMFWRMPNLMRFAVAENIQPESLLFCWMVEVGTERPQNGAEFLCERYLNIFLTMTTPDNTILAPQKSSFFVSDGMLKSKPDMDLVKRIMQRMMSTEERSRMAMILGHNGQLVIRNETTTSSADLHQTSSNVSNRLQQESNQVPISISTGSKRGHPNVMNNFGSKRSRVKFRRSFSDGAHFPFLYNSWRVAS